MNKSVVIVGGGVAGIQAALDLADMGADVHIVEKTPSIGGRMAQLDKTFPTNDCSICILAPKMSECARHPNITLHTYSSIKSLEGEPGNFLCRIIQHPKYVDPTKCTSCGLCEQKCPVKVEDEFDMELRERKAIYRYFLQSIPSNYVIDEANCLYINKGACRLCEKACPAKAINFEDKAKEIMLNCGAIIIAPGIDTFDPIVRAQYGYGKFKDVLTSIEFERLLSASGPTRGHITKADGKEPKKIAFIQCVGSRDLKSANEYCSAICCMATIKEAIIAKEHIKELEPYVFYMDIRAFGKDFDKYYERAEKQFGIRFEKATISKITANNGNLLVRYAKENGKNEEANFDMVILAVGLIAKKEIEELADVLDIRLNEYKFCETDPFNPITAKPGIFVCGGISGPKDIPESVMSASGAAALAAGLLDLPRQEKLHKKEYPEEKFVLGDRPRIGVFVCHCGINIAGVVDIQDVVNFVKTLPYVEWTEDVLYACSQDSLNTIKQRIKELDLNRVVVAACTPRTHEPLFQETLREAGLNQYLFEFANIRDQCSWAHMNEPKEATEKAKELIKMSVSKAAKLMPLTTFSLDIHPDALVIGGGLSGMTSALALANAGHNVHLIEKEKELGGNLRNIYYTLEGKDAQKLLNELIEKVKNNKKIHIYTETKIKSISGYVGNFKTIIQNKKEEEIAHGVVIVATGAKEYKPKEYLYGENKKVLTQIEFEKLLATKEIKKHGRIKSVVMIQCVGSRNDENPYCSRVCCGEAIKNAIKLKEIYPTADVYILYRDIRTYGLKEKYYAKARDKGVIFIRYDLEHKPLVEADADKLKIKVIDPLLEKEIIIDTDLLVISPAIVANEDNKELSTMLKIPLNKEKFFLEAHMKLRPVDFATDGVFLCGLAHMPKYIEESIVQANAAASRALTILKKKKIETQGIVGFVNEFKCTGCGDCISVCPYNAIELDKEKFVAKINEALCKGCGNCSAACRCGAIDLKGFTNEEILQLINAIK